MSTYRESGHLKNPWVKVDKEGKPSETGDGLARESAVKKFLEAEDQVKLDNKNLPKEDKLTAHDLLQEKATREYVKDIEFSNSPEKFLSAEDLQLYNDWLRNAWTVAEERFGDHSPKIPTVIHGILDGKKILLLSNGRFSSYGDEKLDEKKAQQMFENLEALIRQGRKYRSAQREANRRNEERGVIDNFFKEKISVSEVIEERKEKDKLAKDLRGLNFNDPRTIYGYWHDRPLFLEKDGRDGYWGSTHFTPEETIDLFDRLSALKKRKDVLSDRTAFKGRSKKE
jgi:hypothetical protein